MRWDLREALLAMREIERRDASVQYRHDMLVWAVLKAAGAKMKEPDVPEVLKG